MAAMKAKQANDDYVLSKTLQGVTFSIPRKTMDELVTEFLPKYDAEYKACRGYGTAPRTSDSSGGTQHNAASRYFERKGRRKAGRRIEIINSKKTVNVWEQWVARLM